MTSSNHNCKQCNAEYHTSRSGTNFCGQNCRTKWNRAQKKAETIKAVNCAFCNKEFNSSRKNAKFCSKQCTQDWGNLQLQNDKREANNKLYENVTDIPTCVICGWKSRSLQGHLKTHDLTVQQYRDQYNISNDKIFHISFTDEKSTRMSGENNPGYDHGGTMSSFSTRYKQYDGMSDGQKIEAISQQILKANETKSSNAGYNTRSDFYEVRHGMMPEEAKEAVSNRQSTFSLEKCVEKFGEDIGKQVWDARQSKWQETLKALPIDVRKRMLAVAIDNVAKGYSMISQQLFESLSYDALYGEDEAVIFTPTGNVFRVDFLYEHKIIEFNGDYWHANPLIDKYVADDAIIKLPGGKEKTAGEIRTRDAARQQELEEMGYQVLVVWESDYKQNKQQVIGKCLEFLKS